MSLSTYTGDLAPSQFATVIASQTDTALVAAVAGKRIRVLQVGIFAGAAGCTVTFKSKPAGAGTTISPAISVAINDESVLPSSNVGWFDTKVGEGLSVDTSATGPAGIVVATTVV